MILLCWMLPCRATHWTLVPVWRQGCHIPRDNNATLYVLFLTASFLKANCFQQDHAVFNTQVTHLYMLMLESEWWLSTHLASEGNNMAYHFYKLTALGTQLRFSLHMTMNLIHLPTCTPSSWQRVPITENLHGGYCQLVLSQFSEIHSTL